MADEEVRTQQEQIARLLRRNSLLQWQHERLMSSLPVPAFTTDSFGTFESVNSALASFVQVRVDRLLQRPVFSFVDDGDRTALREDLARLVGAGGSFRRVLVVRPRHGEARDVELFCSASTGQPSTYFTWVLFPADRAPAARGRAEVARALVALTALPGLGVDASEMIHRAVEILQRAVGERASLSIAMGTADAPDVVASTSQVAQALDGAQIRADEGPCPSTIESGSVVVTDDVRRDSRWPRLAVHAADLPVKQVVSAPIMVGETVVGTLNVYGAAEAPDDPSMEETASLLAAAVAALHHEVGLKGELQGLADGMRNALQSRAVIDQAKGIVMADRHCSAEEAFEHLVRLSSSQHVKLRDLAATLVMRTVDRRYR